LGGLALQGKTKVSAYTLYRKGDFNAANITKDRNGLTTVEVINRRLKLKLSFKALRFGEAGQKIVYDGEAEI
jgi:hypothetical protein